MRRFLLLLAAVAVLAACNDRDADDPAIGPEPTEPAEECSAEGLTDRPPDGELPAAVADRRSRIIAAALACDYEALADLTASPFTYSFGEDRDPAAYWRDQETRSDPLRMLVELLNRPFAERPVEGAPVQYVWPRAYPYEDWDDVPAEARQELGPLYGPDDFEDFARFGSYAGYRVGISETGDWLFFVAGD